MVVDNFHRVYVKLLFQVFYLLFRLPFARSNNASSAT